MLNPAIEARMFAALQRLTKWRSVFAGWQLGSRALGDAESDALRDHRELTMLMRAELSAINSLMIKKGVYTQDEHALQLTEEASYLSRSYEKLFPGFRATDDGIEMKMPEAQQTMNARNWKP